MKGSCDYKPEQIIKYGKTGRGQFLYNITRNDKETDGETEENWDFEFVEVPAFDEKSIISALIRSRYDENEAEAILANYQQGKDIEKYISFQAWRKTAKAVARGENYDETELQKQAADEAVDNNAIKRLMRQVAEPILQDEANLTEQDVEDVKMLFKQYRVGVIYDKDSKNINEKRFVWNDDLYKVIGAKHTSQADWAPDTAVSLYTKIVPAGQIVAWNADDYTSYQLGTKVTHNNKTWECINPTYAWIEPGSQDGHNGWVEV